MDESPIDHIAMDINLAGMNTKVVYGLQSSNLVGKVLYDIYDDH